MFRYIGKGIYTIPEAARLTKVNPQRIKRWIDGYKYTYKDSLLKSEPVFSSEFRKIDNIIALSFLDLIEIRFIDAFRKHNISMKAIRTAARKASELLKSSHPFASKRFYTVSPGKKTIFLEIEDNETRELIDLLKDQYVMDKIIRPFLHERLEFTPDNIACLWWPLGQDRDVVIDPKRNFGQPIINTYNVPTSAIYNTFLKENSLNDVADWYGVDKGSVSDAIEFEESLVEAA